MADTASGEDRQLRPEGDEHAYTDWHYEQFGCAPTGGQGPAPQYGEAG